MSLQNLINSLDSDWLNSFVFQVVSRSLFSLATYITLPPNIKQSPESGNDYLSNSKVSVKNIIAINLTNFSKSLSQTENFYQSIIGGLLFSILIYFILNRKSPSINK